MNDNIPDAVYVREFVDKLHKFCTMCKVDYTLEHEMENFAGSERHNITLTMRSKSASKWLHEQHGYTKIDSSRDDVLSFWFYIYSYVNIHSYVTEHDIGLEIMHQFSSIGREEDAVPGSRFYGDNITRLNGEYYAECEVDMIANMKAYHLLDNTYKRTRESL